MNTISECVSLVKVKASLFIYKVLPEYLLFAHIMKFRDGYRQKNHSAIYHDTGPVYRDTYHDMYHKI